MIFRIIILVMFAIASRLIWEGTAETRRVRKLAKDWAKWQSLQKQKAKGV